MPPRPRRTRPARLLEPANVMPAQEARPDSSRQRGQCLPRPARLRRALLARYLERATRQRSRRPRCALLGRGRRRAVRGRCRRAGAARRLGLLGFLGGLGLLCLFLGLGGLGFLAILDCRGRQRCSGQSGDVAGPGAGEICDVPPGRFARSAAAGPLPAGGAVAAVWAKALPMASSVSTSKPVFSMSVSRRTLPRASCGYSAARR